MGGLFGPPPGQVFDFELPQTPGPIILGTGQPFSASLQALEQQAGALGHDPWTMAYAQRFRPAQAQAMGVPYVGQEEDRLRDLEHYLYARDTAALGPIGFAQMLMGSPGHALLKATGVRRGDASLEEVMRGLQGAGAGFGQWLTGD